MQNGILGLLKAILEEDLIPPDIPQRYPGYVKAVTTALRAFSWQDLHRSTDIEPDSFRQAAKVLAAGRRVIVLTGQVLLRSERGYAGSLTLLDLLILTGKLDQPGCGFAPLAEENNDQGAVEMGAVAEFLPGACSADNAADRERFMCLWKRDLPLAVGASLVDMLHRAETGSLKAMFMVGRIPWPVFPHRYAQRIHYESWIFSSARNCF